MRVPVGVSECEYEVKRSRFIGRAMRLAGEESVKSMVAARRSEHQGCSHVVYAFVAGEHAERFGFSDDREPKGTAGRPVLEVVRGSGMTDLIVTVVRYFGGTKLGTGGLVRAYTKCAQLALQGLSSEPLMRRLSFETEIPYAAYETVRRTIDEHGGTVSEEDFGTAVRLRGVVPERVSGVCAQAVADATAGQSVLRFDKNST